MMKRSATFFLAMALAAGLPACSFRKFAIKKNGDALAFCGSTYESDEDIQMVAGALPFSLKLVESLITESPKHKGLLQVASQGFASYAYIEVQPRVDAASVSDFETAQKLKTRAKRLYLRRHTYGMTALELSHPGF